MHNSLHVYMFHDCKSGNAVLKRLMVKGEGGEVKKKKVEKREEKRHVHSGVGIMEAHRDST